MWPYIHGHDSHMCYTCHTVQEDVSAPLTLPNCFSVFFFDFFFLLRFDSFEPPVLCNSPLPSNAKGPRAKEVFQIVVKTPTPPPIRLILIFSSVYVCTVVAVAHEITFFTLPPTAAAAAAAPPTHPACPAHHAE